MAEDSRSVRTRQITLVGLADVVHFTSVDDAMNYLQPRLEHGRLPTVTAYGPKKMFRDLQARVREASLSIWWHNRSIVERWMAEASSWNDYFDEKEQRDDLATKFDADAHWLGYGGRQAPPQE